MNDDQKCSKCKKTTATLKCSKCNEVYCLPCVPTEMIENSLIAKCPECGWKLREL